jgi:hypothetical protein
MDRCPKFGSGVKISDQDLLTTDTGGGGINETKRY